MIIIIIVIIADVFSPAFVHQTPTVAWMPCSRTPDTPLPSFPLLLFFQPVSQSLRVQKRKVHSGTKTDNITLNILCQVAPAVCAACVKSVTGPFFFSWQPQLCSPKLASEQRSRRWWKPRADNTTKRGFNFTARSAPTFPEGWIAENLVICNNASVGRA